MRCGVILAIVTCLLSATATIQAAPPDERQMAARIDELLSAGWAQEKVPPAEPAADAEFLRRAWLDLCGKIPPINDDDGISGIRDFLADSNPDKRARLIDELLTKPAHATHFANLWKNVMLPPEANIRRFGGDNGFQTWLYGQFKENVGYDQMVRELVLATGAGNQVGPALFYTALQLKPEDLAAGTSRIFLGTQIQCAQCHDHPFDHWTRKDFWGYAAFFARLQRPAQTQQVAFQVTDAATGEVKIPESDEVVPPRFLGGEVSGDDGDANRRQRLAAWLASSDNPYFARATVNRVWSILFGRGLVDPVDDLGTHNPPSHPELLEELTAYFATDFDLNRLVRTLTYTKAYQLSSQARAGEPDRPDLFARMAIKSLTAEQLYDCLAEGMRRRHPTGANPNFRLPGGADQNRQAFLAKFRAPTQGATDYEAGIPQALTLMNGTVIRQATDLAQSDLLLALDAPFLSDDDRIEVLFLSTLSRMPSEAERVAVKKHVDQGGTSGDRHQALSDVLWALLNSAEFVLNH